MNKALRVLTNKYLVTSIAFAAWTVYFDQNDYFSLQQRQKELAGLKENIAYLNAEIGRMNADKNELQTNPHRQEQYARENYRMKRDGEDVYVVDNVVNAEGQ